MMDTLDAVMVTYNPGERTLESIKKLEKINGIKRVYVIDNSECPNEVIEALRSFSKVCLVKNGKNLGIGAAQNIGMKLALNNGADWVLTLDHDTIINCNLVNKYLSYVNTLKEKNVGIVATDYVDVNTGLNSFDNEQPKEYREVISSGSLINLQIACALGFMKEQYIIDQVDNEYCYRLMKRGYRIVVLPGADMEHSLGNIQILRIFNKQIALYNQAPIRTYYRTRNIIWMVREYGDKDLRNEKIFALIKDFCRIMLEKEKIKKIHCFVKGVIDGLRKIG